MPPLVQKIPASRPFPNRGVTQSGLFGTSLDIFLKVRSTILETLEDALM